MPETFYTFGYYLFYGAIFIAALLCRNRIRKNLKTIKDYKKEHPEYDDKKK